ncbi:hypothetical protein [Epilithonimonas sp. UC225_85]|uniref:hypothetical protein n=1 Tax=Epilithonimonas sp. UC225_85 TaxID=3350167 RepID=UPI0036D3F671
MNVYELSRNYWDYAFQNPDKIKPNHSAMYFFAIEHCNRLGWKEKFGFPTTIVMEAIGIKSYNTFINTLKELVDFGFIQMIEKSKNQYSANIIALSIFNKAPDETHTKALDEALIKHNSKQSESTEQSTDSIDKQIYNTTNIPINNNEAEASEENISNQNLESFPYQINPNSENKEKSSAKKESKVKIFFFKQAMIEYGFNKDLVDHFIEVRKKKRLVNTEVAFKNFIREIEKTGKDKNEVFEIITNKQWGGFEAKWLNNVDQANLKSALSKPGKNVHIA